MRIGQSEVGRSTYVIGEVGLIHEGSLGQALAYIDLIAAAGAHAVKFQTHLAEAEGTAAETFRVPMSGQDATRADYWRRTSFAPEQWALLVRRAHDRGLDFISSPFSNQAVDLLVEAGADGLKIASGETGNTPLLVHAAASGLPVLISSGMSDLTEIDEAVATLRLHGAEPGLFQCTSMYPCPPEQIGLELLSEFRQRFRCPVGLSDHSGTIFAGLAAATLGAEMIEVHVAFSKDMYGPDVKASLTASDLKTLVEGIRFIDAAKGSPVDKTSVPVQLLPMRALFTKSIVAARRLPSGTILKPGDLTTKKPGTGIPARQLETFFGCELVRDLLPDDLLSPTDVVSNK